MTRHIAQLLVLIAVLLMPLGMAPAATAHQAASASMPMGHCPDPAPGPDRKGGVAECTMACAAALPAGDMAAQAPLTIGCEQFRSAAAGRLRGLDPETEPPPPKRS